MKYENNFNHIPGTPEREDMLPTEEVADTGGEKTAFGLAKFLNSVTFPVTKEDLLDYADDQNVEEIVLDMLEQLPDTTYNNPTDVSQALGENSNLVT